MYVYIADSNKMKIVIFTEISKLSVHTFTSNIISPKSLSIFTMSSFHLNTVTISIFFSHSHISKSHHPVLNNLISMNKLSI